MPPWRGIARQGSIKLISLDRPNTTTPRRHVSSAWYKTCLLGVAKHAKEASIWSTLTGLIQPRPGEMSPRRGTKHASLAWQSTPRKHQLISLDRLNTTTPRRHVSSAWFQTCLLGVAKHAKEASSGQAKTGLVQPPPGDMSPRRGRLHASLACQGTPRRPLAAGG